MKNVTDYFEITVAHGHINGIKLANFLRKKSQNIFHWHKFKILQISHLKKEENLQKHQANNLVTAKPTSCGLVNPHLHLIKQLFLQLSLLSCPYQSRDTFSLKQLHLRSFELLVQTNPFNYRRTFQASIWHKSIVHHLLVHMLFADRAPLREKAQ